MQWLKKSMAIPYYFAFVLSVLVWFHAIAPMAFLTDCSVTNKTDSEISFTPVGTVGPDGHRSTLPLYRTSFPYFMKSNVGHFSVAPGNTFHFCYDMDDINFSEIVIRDSRGTVGQIVVNPNPTDNQYIVPGTLHFTFDNATKLMSVPKDVQRVFDDSKTSNGLWILYLTSGTFLMLDLIRQRLAKRRSKC